MKKINLADVNKTICDREKGKREVNIAQVADVMAALGSYMRSVGPVRAFRIFLAIRSRAGVQSKS